MTGIDVTSSGPTADDSTVAPVADGTDVPVVVLLAPAVGRMSVDAATGAVHTDDRGAVASAADAAALETALQLGDAWDVPVTALSAGGAAAETVLRDALAVGVASAVRIDTTDTTDPASVAGAVAAVLADRFGGGAAPLVVAGVHGADTGSAAVPAFVAHHLEAAQALGLVAVRPGVAGRIDVVRRLDRGARERLAVTAPAVISVEGSVARLRRAGLQALLAGGDVEVVAAPSGAGSAGGVTFQPRPYRPRAHVVAGPSGATALDRIRDLTGVAGPSRQSRTIEADPADAAEAILDQLGEWGYGPRAVTG